MSVSFASEALLRLIAFGGVLVALAVFEARFPRRRRRHPRLRRWPSNLGIVALDTLLVRLVFPLAAVGMAVLAAQHGRGLFNIVDLPFWAEFAASFLLLDLAIYAQHVMLHHVPLFWRMHRVHHADLDFDVTTGVRFHPLEILLSMTIKLGVVLLLGPPAVAVLVFEIVLNATSMFNHANLRIPAGVDRILRLVLVTPDMHRVHHSVLPEETNSNYGFNFPWWDRLFRTYRAAPKFGHNAMTIGLPIFRDARELRLDKLLVQPFKRPPATPSL